MPPAQASLPPNLPCIGTWLTIRCFKGQGIATLVMVTLPGAPPGGGLMQRPGGNRSVECAVACSACSHVLTGTRGGQRDWCGSSGSGAGAAARLWSQAAWPAPGNLECVSNYAFYFFLTSLTDGGVTKAGPRLGSAAGWAAAAEPPPSRNAAAGRPTGRSARRTSYRRGGAIRDAGRRVGGPPGSSAAA